MRLPWGLALIWLTVAFPVLAADVTVSVIGVRNDRGIIAVAICDRANFPSGECAYHKRAPARTGTVNLRLTSVPAGTWAVAVYHDEASIGQLEFSLFGVPKQGFGFSRDAEMHYGPPRFADAAFMLTDAESTILVPLHYPPP